MRAVTPRRSAALVGAVVAVLLAGCGSTTAGGPDTTSPVATAKGVSGEATADLAAQREAWIDLCMTIGGRLPQFLPADDALRLAGSALAYVESPSSGEASPARAESLRLAIAEITRVGVVDAGVRQHVRAACSSPAVKGALPSAEPPIHPFRAHLLLCLSQGGLWPEGTPADRALTLLTAGRDYVAGRTDARSLRQADLLTRAVDEVTAAGAVTREALDLIEQGCAGG